MNWEYILVLSAVGLIGYLVSKSMQPVSTTTCNGNCRPLYFADHVWSFDGPCSFLDLSTRMGTGTAW